MMSCIVCSKSDVKLHRIGTTNGKINHTIGDNLKEIYGDKIRRYLTQDSYVCNICMNILDIVAQLKTYIWNIISDPSSKPHPNKLNKFRKIFASLNHVELDLSDTPVPENTKRIDTPSLLCISHSVPFEETFEKHLENKEYERNYPKENDGIRRKSVNTPKSIEKSNSGRRDNSNSKENGIVNRRKSRCESSISDMNSTVYSCSSRQSRRSTTTSMRTRSVSRFQSMDYDANDCDTNYKCSEENCNKCTTDIDEMNIHNIIEHDMPTIYDCNECFNKYTTKYLYKLHFNYHTFSFYCLMCGEEQKNSYQLQLHLDEHMLYSVPCKYCDKSFLSKVLREKHTRSCHKGKRKRQIFKKKLILKRLDKSDHECDKNDYISRFWVASDMECDEESASDHNEENIPQKLSKKSKNKPAPHQTADSIEET